MKPQPQKNFRGLFQNNEDTIQKINLDEKWRMRILGQDEWLPARVPCSMISVLLENGKIGDTYWHTNKEQAG